MANLAVFNSAAFLTAGQLAVAANATIEVRREDTSALASIFSNEAGTAAITNPSAFADSSGRFSFYAAGIARGYSILVTSGAESFTLHNVAIGTMAQLDTSSAITLTGALNLAVGGTAVPTIVKRKTADESVTSSTTLQDDDHLTFPIAANEEWVATYNIDAGTAISAPGIKVAVTTPSGATQSIGASFNNRGSTVNSLRTDTSGAELSFSAAGFGANDALGIVKVWVLNGATPGNVTLQFCQATSSATPVTSRKGGHMVAHRVA